jgi:type VI secretion system secreted protein Hcp
MATDIFLDLGSAVKGESQDDKHKDKIDIESYQWGVSQSGTFHSGSGGGAGKANFKDIQVEKFVDAATADLLKYVAEGKHFDTAKIIVRKAGGSSPLEYLTIELKKVLVSSVDILGTKGDERLRELVTLNFAEIKVTYNQQNEKGAKQASKEFAWNIAANKAA